VDAVATLDTYLTRNKEQAYSKALDRYIGMMAVFPYLEPSSQPPPPALPDDL
jgi:hypothetical protein